LKTPISFRLRKDVDADLIEALSIVEKNRIKDLCRNGLRLMLGIKTTKAIQIVERPIAIKIHSNAKSEIVQKVPLKSTSTTWRPPSKK